MYKIVGISSVVTSAGGSVCRVATRGYKRIHLDDGINVENSLNNNVIFTTPLNTVGDHRYVNYPGGIITKYISLFADAGTSGGYGLIEVQYELVKGDLTDLLYENFKAKGVFS